MERYCANSLFPLLLGQHLKTDGITYAPPHWLEFELLTWLCGLKIVSYLDDFEFNWLYYIIVQYVYVFLLLIIDLNFTFLAVLVVGLMIDDVKWKHLHWEE